MTNGVSRNKTIQLATWRSVAILCVIALFFVVAIVAVFDRVASSSTGINATTQQLQPPSQSFGAAYTVTRTYTSKQSVIINNLWKHTEDIGGGLNHACALSNGKVFCWGDNTSGQLGNGTNTSSSNPVQALGALTGRNVTAISAGGEHTCAIADARAFCWGYNAGGNLGNGNFVNQNLPVAVNVSGSSAMGTRSVTAISAGGYHTCAIADARAYCWGRNGEGQLGNSQPSNPNLGQPASNSCVGCTSAYPVAVGGGSVYVTSIAAGANHTCAVSLGAAYCWGGSSNTSQGGRLGHGGASGPGSNVNAPVAVSTAGVLSGRLVTQVAAGASQSCAIASARAYCWGPNLGGELGTGNALSSNVPVAVSTSSPSALPATATVTNISTGVYTDQNQYQTCAVADGRAYCWGHNTFGQLGDGTNTNSLAPVAVSSGGVLSGKYVRKVTPGTPFACGIANGRAYCWGRNNVGQLGNGTTIDANVPYRVNDSYY